MPNTKLLLSQLSIDGQLYQLKDSALTTTVNNLSTQVGNIATEVETHDTKIYALQQALGGLDATTVASLEKITQELQGTENETTQAFVTLVDRLKGIGNNSEGEPATVVEYVTDHVTEKITALANEIYYKSEVKYVVMPGVDENGATSLYDADTETLNLTTYQYRLLSAETGSAYVSE